MASKIYNSFKKKVMQGSIAVDTATIKLALVTNSYVPNIDTHDFFDDITNEVSGTNYVAGGAALANKSITIDTVNDLAYFDADDASWVASAITAARYGILYEDTGTASTSPLIGYIDFLADKSTNGDTFNIQFAATGILSLT